MKISEGIKEAILSEGQRILSEPRRFEAFLRDTCHGAHRGEIHISCGFLAAGLFERYRGRSLASTDKRLIQKKLYELFGADAGIALLVIGYWEPILAADNSAELPDDPNALVERAREFQASGEHERADQMVERAIALAPDNPLVHFCKAELLRARGRLHEALKAADQASKLDPENLDFTIFAGEIDLLIRSQH